MESTRMYRQPIGKHLQVSMIYLRVDRSSKLLCKLLKYAL